MIDLGMVAKVRPCLLLTDFCRSYGDGKDACPPNLGHARVGVSSACLVARSIAMRKRDACLVDTREMP